MNKEEVLKQLFLLPKEDILDIYKIIHGYKCTMNKAKKDTLAIRYVYMNGYYSMKEFNDKFNITKDSSVGRILVGKGTNVKGYIKLKKFLNLDDDLFDKILMEVIDNDK